MKPKPRSAFHIFNIPEAIVRYFPFFSPKLDQAPDAAFLERLTLCDVLFRQFVFDFLRLFFGHPNQWTAIRRRWSPGLSVPNHPANGSLPYKIARNIWRLSLGHFAFAFSPSATSRRMASERSSFTS
jgi:hypothetical protein